MAANFYHLTRTWYVLLLMIIGVINFQSSIFLKVYVFEVYPDIGREVWFWKDSSKTWKSWQKLNTCGLDTSPYPTLTSKFSNIAYDIASASHSNICMSELSYIGLDLINHEISIGSIRHTWLYASMLTALKLHYGISPLARCLGFEGFLIVLVY